MREWSGPGCFLRHSSPFKKIFPGIVPIKSVEPVPVKLEGSKFEELAFILAWEACWPVQQREIAELVTKLRGGDPGEFLRYMAGGGQMPIRVNQTTGVLRAMDLFA